MSWFRIATGVTTVVVALLAAAAPAAAQAEPTAPFQIGSLGLSPVIRLTNVGWDSNVYHMSELTNPPDDVTAALKPSVDAVMRTPKFRLTAHSQWDYYYFNRLSELRALDIDQSGRVELTLNRLSPYVTGSWTTTRHRQNLEIDAPVRRNNQNVEGGTYVQVSGKTFIGIYGGRSQVDYEDDARFLGVDLAPTMNHDSVYGALSVRYQATPLTTLAFGVLRERSEFEVAGGRDSDSWLIGPSVEFKPLALISGRAAIGYRKVTFRDSIQPEFNSTVAAVDLQYTMRGQTQFGVNLQRNLEYSFLDTQVDYVLTGVTTTVNHRLNAQWDAGGFFSHYGIGYRRNSAIDALGIPNEAFWNYGANVGYRLGRQRVALDVDYGRRDADVALREYDRLRVGASLTYVF